MTGGHDPGMHVSGETSRPTLEGQDRYLVSRCGEVGDLSGSNFSGPHGHGRGNLSGNAHEGCYGTSHGIGRAGMNTGHADYHQWAETNTEDLGCHKGTRGSVSPDLRRYMALGVDSPVIGPVKFHSI